MANWCNNTVVFEGTDEAIEQITQLFKTMAEREQKENCGQLPEFVQDTNGDYFFSISQDNEYGGVFQYETKWSPNTEAVKQIAEHFNVDFTHEYEELGCLVYGKATFENGTLTDTCLDSQDFDSYELEEETDTYHFEGKEYNSEWEILETLLGRKIENQLNIIKI
ncbi:MAG: hypothetical protein BGP13_02110 [Sphingobacteriales bacterium 40-81]|nr:MAG: hypothetical protein BGP13_02110 [Sphingobacteriales bacterium 40-81]